jgi:hypothetical protein
MTVERSTRRAELLDHQPVPVRTDVFIHNVEPVALEALRRALAQGLRLSGLDFGGDDASTVVVRFTRMPPDSELLERFPQ